MRKEFYITTSIFYTNAKPHIGHLLEMVQADVLARWRRIQGDDVFFLSGTDEHGTKIARTAEIAGKEPQQFVDEIAQQFRELKDSFDLSWDDFIRTTDQARHWPGVEKIWQKLEKNGDIYEKKYRGLYCVGCETFLTEKDLVDGVCLNHKAKPELIEESNLFFRLSKYEDQILKLIESRKLDIQPDTRRNEMLSFVRRGLEDVSFSRSKDQLKWGVPVPGNTDQTMYVWCDALSNYITAIGYGRDEKEFKKWWPADIHIVGKDILRFHAVIWPAMLLSAGLPLPKSIFVHGFITAEGEKLSKSVGNVIDPVELLEKYSSDAIRYYLLSQIPSDEDGDFNIKRFEEGYNADLANGLGNFASRVTTLAEGQKDFKGLKLSEEIQAKIMEVVQSATKDAERFKLHEVVASIWSLIKFGDGYINEQKPWETKDPQVISNLVYLLDTIAGFTEPIVPEASKKIQEAIIKENGGIIGVEKIQNLFPRLPQADKDDA
ncbi:MAG: methionine--tRNA ligase [Candidatus Colwellbacteria bacterium CG10_big_fil_rev_8_21_14_0_10_42_22]|uniref:methionine--tRNA ligase n=1 Tax=Candidatus Colwellbacteria bacterium CG10_big_fil_rev_8_21_14_0_10_42_22 TaxID=1974540 RepID=A0A2H0VG33_9BACT|nr:MAG: methionine--tRNA ligase [Candidatus Colwellbacteria bacterium CG10_big_fil_rev_8_21_14_0_10_42_22]